MATDKPHNRLNVSAVINHFGGAPHLAKLSARHGGTINHEVVRKWRQRESIPSDRLEQLVALGRAIGKPFVIDRFIVSEKDT